MEGDTEGEGRDQGHGRDGGREGGRAGGREGGVVLGRALGEQVRDPEERPVAAGSRRSCRSDQEPTLTTPTVTGTQRVTNGGRDCHGVRRTTTALHPGMLASRS